MAKIANVALTNTFDTWRTRSNEAFDRLSQFAVNNSRLYANTIIANNVLKSVGNTVLGSATKKAVINGILNANGNLIVSGNTTLGAASKLITSTGAWAHTGTGSISTNFTVSGNTTLGAAGKTQTSTGAWSHTGTKTISTNLTVSGNTTMGAAGKTQTSTGAWSHTGTKTISTNLTVSGNTIVSGTVANLNSFGFYSNNAQFAGKKIRNFSEDAKSYRNSATAITVDSDRNTQRITLNGNATVTLPSNMPGVTESVKSFVLVFKQDATGSRTMALAAPVGETIVYNNSATIPPIATAANKITIYVCTKFDGDNNWYVSQSFIQA